MSLFSSEKHTKGREGVAGGAADKALILQFDGGSRGNPGPAGIGVVLTDEGGKRVYELGEYLGECTNNVAEYTALVRGLSAAKELGAKRVVVRADSELVVRQINGVYKVKSPDLKPLYQRAISLIDDIGDVKVAHVYRESNARADELANLAMDGAINGTTKIEPLGPVGKRTVTGALAQTEVAAMTGLAPLRKIFQTLRSAGDELPPAQVEALLIIAERPGVTVAEVGDEVGLSLAAASTAAEALTLRHRFVRLEGSAEERWARQAFLTPAGAGFVQRLLGNPPD